MEDLNVQSQTAKKLTISFSCATPQEAIELYQKGIIPKDIDISSKEPYDKQAFAKLQEMYVQNMQTGMFSYDIAYNNYLDEPEIDRLIAGENDPVDISSIQFGDNTIINTVDGNSHEYRDRNLGDKVKDLGKTAKSVTAALFTRYIVMKANRIPEVENKIMSETSGGLYHFTSDRSADKILKSGEIKASGRNSSYSMKKKTFFFENNTELDDIIYNIGNVEKKMTAVKVKPNEQLQQAIDNGKLHVRLDDGAICIVGDTKCKDGYELEKVTMRLMERDGKYYYAEANEQSQEMNTDEQKLDNVIDRKIARYRNMPAFLRDTLTFPRNAKRAFKKFKENLGKIDKKRLPASDETQSRQRDINKTMMDNLTTSTYPPIEAGGNMLEEIEESKGQEYTKGEI